MNKFILQIGIIFLLTGLLQVSYGQTGNSAVATRYKVASGSGAYLREGPGLQQPVLLNIPDGTQVQVVDTSNSEAYQVVYQGKIGYLPAYLLEAVEKINVRNPPHPPARQPLQPPHHNPGKSRRKNKRTPPATADIVYLH